MKLNLKPSFPVLGDYRTMTTPTENDGPIGCPGANIYVSIYCGE